MSENFGSTLSGLRQEKHLSQRVVAKELGVSQAVLSHYENGVREPGLDFVVRAAEYYRVSTDYLLGRTVMREDFAVAPQALTKLRMDEESGQKETREFYTTNKKLLLHSLAMIFDIADQSESLHLISNLAMYFNVAIYKMFRQICRLSGEEKTAELFNIPDTVWENLSDAEMELCEVRIRASKKDDVPRLSAESLREDYAEQMPSLLATVHVAGRRLKALLRKKEK